MSKGAAEAKETDVEGRRAALDLARPPTSALPAAV